ncbi:MAG: dinitrogenase iron-molybdenum cofactor biosynthesis protein [Anaerolinea sp.]|nr:dinitrogenase iron-molybdenum cofactor biosynthesis protein [Anaerolinea sp.]
MKIAVAVDDGSTISRHFGRAPYYLVFTAVEGEIVGQETFEKTNHHQSGHEHHHEHTHDHAQMIDPIRDCEALIVRGMGRGAYLALEHAGIRPIVTDVENAEQAVRSYIAGTLVNHTELLH